MSRPLIELRDVHKHYGDYHALRGITLDIAEGEFFSLLGPSGCGKTTLLRTIAGFEDLSAGTLKIDGQSMEGVPPNRRPTNMVFQSYAIFPHLTVAQNVGFGLRRDPRSKAEKAQAVEEALAMVGLAGYGGRAAHALSGGQRQRVALARALILRPRVLLLDEPLSALDKKLREQMQDELRRLQRQVGITFILVTHDQEEALIMSDRIAVMFEGQIAQLATPQELYRRPVTRRVGEFIGVMNVLPCRVETAGEGEIRAEVAGLGPVVLAPEQCPGGISPGAAAAGIRPEAMSVLEPDAGGATGAHSVAATVAEVTYFGDMTYYDVRLDGVEAPLRVSMKNGIGARVLDRGASCLLAWEPRALVLFDG